MINLQQIPHNHPSNQKYVQYAKNPVSDIKALPYVDNSICGRFKVKCVYHDREDGCTATPERSNLLDHLQKSCQWYPIKCKNNCGQLVRRMLMDNHIADECRETIIKCIDYQQAGCNFEGKRASYKQHLNETCRFHPCEKFNCKWRGLLQDRVGHVKNDCDWTVIDCTLGCGEQMERIDLSVHLEDQCKVNKQSIQKQKDIQRLESINKVQSKVSFEVHGREFCTTKENLKRYARESLL